MSSYLHDVSAHYAEARDRLGVLTDGMSDETFNAKPSAKGWSVGECVVHLNTIGKGYLPVLEGAITPAAPRGEGPFRYGWVTRRFIEAVRPGSRPMSTAGSMKPPPATGLRSDIDRERALSRFDADVERFIALCTEADGVDVGRIKVSSPFLPILRLPVGGFLEALGLHAVRHVGQAERAAQAADAASGQAASG
ncbi:MAG: DinB family protein [Bacteroidota bacterium]